MLDARTYITGLSMFTCLYSNSSALVSFLPMANKALELMNVNRRFCNGFLRSFPVVKLRFSVDAVFAFKRNFVHSNNY